MNFFRRGENKMIPKELKPDKVTVSDLDLNMKNLGKTLVYEIVGDVKIETLLKKMKNDFPEKIRIDVFRRDEKGIQLEHFLLIGKTEQVINLCSQYLSKKVITGGCQVDVLGVIDIGIAYEDDVFQFLNYGLKKEFYEKITEKIREKAEKMQEELNPNKKVEVFKEGM